MEHRTIPTPAEVLDNRTTGLHVMIIDALVERLNDSKWMTDYRHGQPESLHWAAHLQFINNATPGDKNVVIRAMQLAGWDASVADNTNGGITVTFRRGAESEARTEKTADTHILELSLRSVHEALNSFLDACTDYPEDDGPIGVKAPSRGDYMRARAALPVGYSMALNRPRGT